MWILAKIIAKTKNGPKWSHWRIQIPPVAIFGYMPGSWY